MATYELTGTVNVIMDPVTFPSGFTKREFVVTTDNERYPQSIKFECVKDRCVLLDGIQPNQRVTVSFDVRGNEYKGRYFVSLSAWNIVAASPAPVAEIAGEHETPGTHVPLGPDDPDIPF